MIQLSPQETFPIVRQLADPNDATTYYVRAVIRNSGTGAIIMVGNNNYLNLTKDGVALQRYAANWGVLVEEGTFIDITTLVYTDSGYTTLSTVYGAENDTYVVQTRWGLQFNAGSGAPVNYDTIKQLLLEASSDLKRDFPKEVDLNPILRNFDRIHQFVDQYEAPVQKDVDLTPLLQRHEILSKKIDNLPKFKPTDLTSLQASLGKLLEFLNKIHTKINDNSLQTELDRFIGRFTNVFSDITQNLREDIKQTKFHISVGAEHVVKPSPSPKSAIDMERVNKFLE